MSLFRFLNYQFADNQVFLNESFALRTDKSKTDYCAKIKGMGQTVHLLHLSLERCMKSVSRKTFLEEIKPHLSPQILQYVSDIFRIPMYDSDGNVWTMNGIGIPPIGPLAYCFFNFYLNLFDKNVLGFLPAGFQYYRYNSEIVISIPVTDKEQQSFIAREVTSALQNLHLYEGMLTVLVKGGDPIQSEGGLLSVDNEGMVHLV